MKVKELIERLQSLDQDLDVYIYNEKEHSLFLTDTVNQTCDYGESENGECDWEDFITIFPTTNSQSLFTLTAEEVEVVYNTLNGLKILASSFDPAWRISEEDSRTTKIADKLLNKIKQWQNENRTNNTAE